MFLIFVLLNKQLFIVAVINSQRLIIILNTYSLMGIIQKIKYIVNLSRNFNDARIHYHKVSPNFIYNSKYFIRYKLFFFKF